jgi:hypothetical protein
MFCFVEFGAFPDKVMCKVLPFHLEQSSITNDKIHLEQSSITNDKINNIVKDYILYIIYYA